MEINNTQSQEYKKLVKNSEIEGECRIDSIKPYKLDPLKLFISVFLCLLTGGLLGAVFKFSLKIRLKFFYSPVTLEKSSHFLVLNQDHTFSIVKIHLDEHKNRYFVNRFLRYVWI